MSNAPSQQAVQKLIKARSDSYGEAFNTLSVDGIMFWQSKDIEFNDVTMDEYKMDNSTTRNFFAGVCQAASSMKILEDSTFGSSPEFVAWELLIEVTYSVDEPNLGIKKGQTGRIRGVSLQWWKWEGEGQQWDGDLSEKSVQGWKIIKENDYMVTLKDGAKGRQVGWL